jgi:hypothetical protein
MCGVYRKINTKQNQFLFKRNKILIEPFRLSNKFIGEFDPGSGRTLAACLTHASRTENSAMDS